MKRNKWLLSLAVGLLCCGSAYAQTTVKGKITSESGGTVNQGLPSL